MVSPIIMYLNTTGYTLRGNPRSSTLFIIIHVLVKAGASCSFTLLASSRTRPQRHMHESLDSSPLLSWRRIEKNMPFQQSVRSSFATVGAHVTREISYARFTARLLSSLRSPDISFLLFSQLCTLSMYNTTAHAPPRMEIQRMR